MRRIHFQGPAESAGAGTVAFWREEATDSFEGRDQNQESRIKREEEGFVEAAADDGEERVSRSRLRLLSLSHTLAVMTRCALVVILIAMGCPRVLEAASVFTPRVWMEEMRSDFGLDDSFLSGAEGAGSSRVVSEEADGSKVTTLAGSYEGTGSRTVETERGGGTLNYHTASSFAAVLRQRERVEPGAWAFDSALDFASSLTYSGLADTYGRFTFILGANNTNSLSFARYVRVVVDQPMVLRLSLSATLSQGDFSDFSSNVLLRRDSASPTGWLFNVSSRNLTGSEALMTVSGSGSSLQTEYHYTASGNQDGVTFDIFLYPKEPDDPETLELRWFLGYESELNGFRANRLEVDLDESGTVREFLFVAPVPEPSSVLFVLTGGAAACLARRRSGRKMGG